MKIRIILLKNIPISREDVTMSQSNYNSVQLFYLKKTKSCHKRSSLQKYLHVSNMKISRKKIYLRKDTITLPLKENSPFCK